MGGATTRGRKKATAADADEPTAEAPAAQWGELQSRVEQLTVSLAVAEDKRVAFEAETRQAITEVRFELRNLQQKHYRETKALQEKCQDLQMQNVATKSSVATLERHLDRFLTVLRARPEPSAAAELDDAPTGKHQHVHTDAGSDVGSDVSLAVTSDE